jgi:hypothetical protein
MDGWANACNLEKEAFLPMVGRGLAVSRSCDSQLAKQRKLTSGESPLLNLVNGDAKEQRKDAPLC